MAIADNQADALASALAPWPARGKTHQVTTYFDTADTKLARLGLSLRVRRTEGRFVQTLKADRTAGVAANRVEWEWPVEANLPDPHLLEATPHWQLPPDVGLQPVVVTTIDRTVRVIEREDGTQIEVALDEGVISAGNARQPVRELELELRQGNVASLLQWALELHAAVPLTIESETKSQRGYRLRNNASAASSDALSGPPAQKPDSIALSPDMPAAEAFRRMVTAALGHLLANQPASLASEARGLRQMRLAIRRLRAALTLFKPHLQPGPACRFKAELRRIGQLFKEARDWDAFCLRTLPNAPRSDALLPAQAANACEAAHHDLLQELRAPPFTALALGLAAWVEQGALTDPARLQPLSQLASPLLDRLAKKLCKRGRFVERQSEAEQHALRKALADLRHGIGYFAPLYPEHAADAWLRNCVSLRKTLGGMNEAARASTLAARLGHNEPPSLAHPTANMPMPPRHGDDDALPRLAAQWSQLWASPRFWA